MNKIIAIGNQKGGVGKTTTTLNLSASLALLGERVLIIDSDPQANLTSGIGIKKEQTKGSLLDIYTSKADISTVVIPTSVPNLYLLPASMELFIAEVEMFEKPEKEIALKKALQTIKDQFRFIFIDTPPSFGILTLNALVAADSVLVPVQCEYFALEGLSLLIKILWRLRSSFNESLALEGILLTMYNRHISLSKQVADEVRSVFKTKVYDAVIPRNITLAEAPSYGQPAVIYAPHSLGAQGYLALAKEVLNDNTLLF